MHTAVSWRPVGDGGRRRGGRPTTSHGALATAVLALLLTAVLPPGDGHAVTDAVPAVQEPPADPVVPPLRPGMAIVPERVVPKGADSDRVSCSVGFLVEDQHGRVYGTTVGHCYANTGDHPTGVGFEDYRPDGDDGPAGGTIDPRFDAVHAAVDCGTSSGGDQVDDLRLCESDTVYGKFVYAINNPFGDAVDGRVNGTHNSEVGIGDFALFRLHPRVDHDAAMCLYGGPERLYARPVRELEVVPVRMYGAGFALGYNVTAGGPIAPSWTGVAVMGRPQGVDRQDSPPWSNDYTFTSTFAPDPGASGGPVMTTDGAAVGLQGGIHYLDRLDTNLQRAGAKLGLEFTLLTAPLTESPRPDSLAGELGAGPQQHLVDEECTPPTRRSGS